MIAVATFSAACSAIPSIIVSVGFIPNAAALPRSATATCVAVAVAAGEPVQRRPDNRKPDNHHDNGGHLFAAD